MCIRDSRETHRHDYTRLPASLGDEVVGMSISLGLFAGPPLILSTESGVVMDWKVMSTAIATRAAAPCRRQEMSGGSVKSALLGPMSSDGAETLTHALVAEPYSSNQVRPGALQAVFYSNNRVARAVAACPSGTVTSRRGRETHRHDYTRLPASLGDEVVGMSISLGLFAGPVSYTHLTLPTILLV